MPLLLKVTPSTLLLQKRAGPPAGLLLCLEAGSARFQLSAFSSQRSALSQVSLMPVAGGRWAVGG